MRKNFYAAGTRVHAFVRLLPFIKKPILLLLSVSISFLSIAQKKGDLKVVQGERVKSVPSLRNFRADPNYKLMVTRDLTGLIFKKTAKMEQPDYGSKTLTDPAVQQSAPSTPAVANVIGQNYEGMGFTNVAPADPTLATGGNYVLQMINGSSGSYLKIWDKTGAVVVNQVYMDLLFAVPGYNGAGDPVVLYDQFADRYFITEFGRSGGSTFVNTLVIAVSQTNNPADGWTLYKYADNTFFVDYPHFGVWPNALYATSNDFNTTGTAYLGSSLYAFDKAAMIAGAPTAQSMRQRYDDAANTYISLAPVSVSGNTPPPAGSPGLFAYFNDDSRTADPADVDFLQLMTFQPDFANPAASVTANGATINTAAFRSNWCNYNRNCIPAAGTSYDAVADRIMNRIYYRNFGSHESLVMTHTVDANAGTGGTPKAGLRWYELRRSGAAWDMYQQSTYAPDNDSRWMGTIGINAAGQIALGYNHSGVGKFASIYFVGRNAADPLNAMTTAETLVFQGTGFGDNSRWGDYNDIVTDANDATFWMTAMYGTSSYWNTRIASFNIGDACPTVTGLPATLPNYSYNKPFSVVLSGSGSTATPFTFALQSGALPTGLSLNTSTGEISGIPTGTSGSSSSFLIRIRDANGCIGTKAYTLTSNNVFDITQNCNPAAITIPGAGTATPYPSTINVTGLPTALHKVTVTLSNFNHTYTNDVDIMLVGPQGQRAIILSDVGNETGVSNVTITLDDNAALSLPNGSAVISGTFKPTNYDTQQDPFTGQFSTANVALSTFAGTNPNGTWSLYVVDDEAGDLGNINGGWCLTFSSPLSAPTITCPANVTVNTEPGTCAASVTLPIATSTGNPTATVLYSVAGLPITSPHTFQKGITTVTATASNGVAPDASCTFTVTVIAPNTDAIIHDAFALASGVAANTVYIGYAPASSVTLTAQPVGGTSPFTYLWSTGATTQSITVSPTVATTYTVTITSADGCVQTASKQINVVDVRCGNKLDKVTVCQVPPGKPSNTKTVCINSDGVADQLAKGSYLGACQSNSSITRAGNGFNLENVNAKPEVFSVQTSPNPTSKYFMLNIRSKNTQPVQISIVNGLGKLIEAKYNVPANGTLQIGQHYRSGTYYASIVQGKERIIVKLIKIAQ